MENFSLNKINMTRGGSRLEMLNIPINHISNLYNELITMQIVINNETVSTKALGNVIFQVKINLFLL
jgi:hypothetical protein